MINCHDFSIAATELEPGREYIYVYGTPLYKGIRSDLVFSEIIKDYKLGRLKLFDLKGNFLIVFVKNRKVKILSDKTFQHHLFYDFVTKTLSSSILKLVKARSTKLEINLAGFYEKVAFGYHLSEETVFKDIIRICPENAIKVETFDIEYISDHLLPYLDDLASHSQGKKKSIRTQGQHLEHYFSLINETFSGEQGDLGLSGGFDCRLLLALAERKIETPLHLHTHATKGVHESQSRIAELIAESYGNTLTKIPTEPPEKLDRASFSLMLEKNIDFFDGRSARHLGAFSQTYTADYKRASMGSAGYSLNGLGGEIYRDSYFTGKKKMSWPEWAERYLFLEGASAIMPVSELEAISLKAKFLLEKKLRWDKNYYDITFTHSYYGLIKMPLCNGSVVHAYNKVSPFLLPFVEYENVLEGLRAIPYLGVGGGYQAALMSRVSPALASLPSHYGGSFRELGLKYYFWSLIKTVGSAKRRDQIVLKDLIKKSYSKSARDNFERLAQNHAFEKWMSALLDVDNKIKLNIAMNESTQKRNLIFLGALLEKYL